MAFASPASARGGIPVHDADGDGWYDGFESATGSSPTDRTKTPESVATATIPAQLPELAPEIASCQDGIDNDGDGKVDSNPGNADPGCNPPPVATSLAAADDFAAPIHVEIKTIDIALPFPGNPHCTFEFSGDGGTVVKVDPPSGGTAGAEVTAAQVDGVAQIAPSIPPTCPLGPNYRTLVQVIGDSTAPSLGSFTDNNPDPLNDFPATAQVDLHAILITQLGNGPFAAPLQNANVSQMPPYCTNCDPDDAGNDCFSAGSLTMCMLPPATDPVVNLDYFKQYQVKAPKFTPQTVALQDAYGSQQTGVVVKKPISAATPAKATPDGDAILDPAAHLKCYQVKAPNLPKPYPNVTIGDPYGHRVLQVQKRTSLCVPAQALPQAPPVGLDSYECYKVKPASKFSAPSLSLEDEFGTQGPVTMSTMVAFCAPVSINSELVPDPAAHLTCYKISKATPKLPVGTRDLDDRFGLESGVQFKKPTQLCAPASKF